jgi:hypothetical protein
MATNRKVVPPSKDECLMAIRLLGSEVWCDVLTMCISEGDHWRPSVRVTFPSVARCQDDYQWQDVNANDPPKKAATFESVVFEVCSDNACYPLDEDAVADLFPKGIAQQIIDIVQMCTSVKVD